jgi:hypothetical protein
LGFEWEYSRQPGVAGAGGGSACEHARWPDPPSAEDSGADDVEFVVAFRSVSYGEGDVEPDSAVGYDLDDRCTCQGEGPSCAGPETTEPYECDGPAGRDNAIAQLFDAIQGIYPDYTSEAATQDIAEGGWTVLVRVREYNGQPNDARVVVAVYPSSGLDKDPCHPEDEPPRWNGADRWPVASFSVQGPAGSGGSGGAGSASGGAAGAGGLDCEGASGYDVDAPIYVDENAYVADSVLVASMPRTGISFTGDGGDRTIILQAGFLSAKIELEAGDWVLRDGTITGRWALTDLLGFIGKLRPADDALCIGHPVYELMRGIVCRYPDITADVAAPTAPCDALSAAIAFDADPAELGIVFEAGTPNEPICPPETDPAGDDCARD